MKKNISILIIFVVTALFFNTGCSSKIIKTKSVWLKSDIEINGSINDWEEIPVISTDDDNTFNFKLCNDNDYLYTVFYSRNLHLSGQIKTMGLKLWVDSTGGKNKKRGLFFRGGPELSKKRDLAPPEEHFEGKVMQFPTGDIPFGKDKFAVINNEGDEYFILQDGTNGPAIGYSISNGTLIYEFKIPLRVKELESFAIGAKPGDEISICLELQGGEKSEGMGGRQRPQGGPPGRMNMVNEQIGGGMPPGGGGGPGRGRPPGGEPPEETKKEVWIKIHLASK